MNELGQVSIDSSFVPGNTPLQELLNGCICCTIQGELTYKLYQMVDEYDLDCIYIEATGAAHPIEVFFHFPFLWNKIPLSVKLLVEKNPE